MATSSTLDHAAMSWTELSKANILSAELFQTTNFVLPGGRYRGTPPISMFCKAFPKFREAKNLYHQKRDEGKSQTEAKNLIEYLLEVKKGVMAETDEIYWKEKAKTHIAKLARKSEGSKRKMRETSGNERDRYLKKKWAHANDDEHTDPGPSLAQPMSSSTNEYTVAAETPLQNPTTLVTHLTQHDERTDPGPSVLRLEFSSIDEYAVAAETQLLNSSTLVTHLKRIQEDPIRLASFLSTERTNALPNVKPFLDGLRSGRLRPIKDAKAADWGDEIPEMFEVKDVCPRLDLEAVWGTAIMNAKQGTVYESHRNGQPLPFEPSFISTFCRGISVGQPKYVVNIPLGDIKLYLPHHIEERYKIYQQEDEDSVFLAQANIGTFGSVVDIHEDRGYLGATAMDHSQIKFWSLYPYHPNKSTYERTANGSARYPLCEEQLIGGLYALTYPGQGLVFKCLHATWTICGGSLFGINVAVAECAVMAAEILRSDLLAGKATSTGDMEPFLKSLHAAVVADMEDSWQQALGTLCDFQLRHFREKRVQRRILDLVEKIRLQLSQRVTEVCQVCGRTWEMHVPFALKLRGTESGRRPRRK